MHYPNIRRLKFCLWTIPISGVLGIGALFLRDFMGIPGEDLVEWANTVSSSQYLVSQYLYMLAYVLPFFGFWALYMFLLKLGQEPNAFWGLMGTLLGTGLPLTTMGVFAYASPALGKLFLQGETHLPQIITEIAMGPSMAIGMPGAFLYVGGCALFGRAIWKSGAIAKWAGGLLVLHSLFLVFGFGFPLLLVLSWLFFILSGIGFLKGIQKNTLNS